MSRSCDYNKSLSVPGVISDLCIFSIEQSVAATVALAVDV